MTASRRLSRDIRYSSRSTPRRHAAGACLAKWHGIEKGQALRPDELQHIAAVIERWLRMQSVGIPEEPAQGPLL
jgi:hypothetical protein